MTINFTIILILIFISLTVGSDFFSQSSFAGFNKGGSQDSKYYDILGVDRTCKATDIRKAYRRKAMEMHPDRGGDAEMFKELAEAYEVLSNDEKRAVYDQYGSAGLNGSARAGGQDFGDLAELFRSFGGLGGLGSRFRGFSAPLIYQLEVSLEDLYKGRQLEIQIGDKSVSLFIEPGSYSGLELLARNAASDGRGDQRDVLFRIREQSHPAFIRKNADLLVDVEIDLKEALFGFEKRIVLLDGKEVWVRSKEGEPVEPSACFIVEGKGMPIYKSPAMRGHLFVRALLKMPRKVLINDADKIDQLKQLLDSALTGRHYPSSSSTSGNVAALDAKMNLKRGRGKQQEQVLRPGTLPLKRSNIQSFGRSGAYENDEDEDGGSSNPFYFFR